MIGGVIWGHMLSHHHPSPRLPPNNPVITGGWGVHMYLEYKILGSQKPKKNHPQHTTLIVFRLQKLYNQSTAQLTRIGNGVIVNLLGNRPDEMLVGAEREKYFSKIKDKISGELFADIPDQYVDKLIGEQIEIFFSHKGDDGLSGFERMLSLLIKREMYRYLSLHLAHLGTAHIYMDSHAHSLVDEFISGSLESFKDEIKSHCKRLGIEARKYQECWGDCD